MFPYESSTEISSQSRGPNGSAFQTFGWSPQQERGIPAGSAGMTAPVQAAYQQYPFAPMQVHGGYPQQPFAIHPLLRQQAFQPALWFQQPQQGFIPAAQGGFVNPMLAQVGQVPQISPQTPWAAPQQQIGFAAGVQQANVITTRAVDIDLTLPAQIIANRNPVEIQGYVLYVVVPTLL